MDPSHIRVLPLQQRRSYIDIEQAAVDPDAPPSHAADAAAAIGRLADAIIAARNRGAAVILAYGAHLVKNGCCLLVNDLLQRGWVTHLATQGAGIIHDLEFALIGRSSESVRDNAPVGRFGTWDETGRFILTAALLGAADGLGLGESVGRLMANRGCMLPSVDQLTQTARNLADNPRGGAYADLQCAIRENQLPTAPHRIAFPATHERYSITCAAHQNGVPLTVHPGIGYDIFACHPMFSAHAGAAIGRTATTDFHIFTHAIRNLSGGVYLSVGSSVMSPQIFEKAFSIANNLRQVEGQPFVRDHYIAVVDIQDGGGWDWSTAQEPPMDHPAYYLRWCKTFARMTQNEQGPGRLDYIRADNRIVLHNLVCRLRSRCASGAPADRKT